MSPSLSRRDFLMSLGAIAAVPALPLRTAASALQSPVYRSFARDHGDWPNTIATANIRFGYAAITWGGKDEQAIKEISEVGFRGIQLRSNILEGYGKSPLELRALLDQHRLEMVALSSGGVGIAAGSENDEIAKHVRNARFVHDVGGHYLQVTDSARPKDRAPAESDFKQLGHILNEIGKRTTDLGITLGYHNHMASLGEAPEQVDRILAEADPRYVKLELDIAHYQQGGGDPAKAIRLHHDRLLFLHIKDLEGPLPGLTTDGRGRAYRFVELGRGKVDLPGVFAALKEVKFRGWAVVELDSVPEQSRTPKESALISKKYIEDRLGMKI